jgi:outer membrane protein assembly factor BamB
MRRAAIILLLLSGLTTAGQARQAASDVTQWRGTNRDGTQTGFTAPAAWPAQLTQRWKIEVGTGYATPIVVGNRVYVFARQGEEEVMSAIDAASGKVIWRTAYAAPFEMNSAARPHGPGPKSTPVFFNGRLYSIGMTGAVTAFDAATGKQLWQKPGSMPLPMYTSHSFSPLIEGNTVIFHVGGHRVTAPRSWRISAACGSWSRSPRASWLASMPRPERSSGSRRWSARISRTRLRRFGTVTR